MLRARHRLALGRRVGRDRHSKGWETSGRGTLERVEVRGVIAGDTGKAAGATGRQRRRWQARGGSVRCVDITSSLWSLVVPGLCKLPLTRCPIVLFPLPLSHCWLPLIHILLPLTCILLLWLLLVRWLG